jgi:hypothetical protein
VSQAHREVTGARADVGDHGLGLERQGLDHLVRFLPGIARRVVEHPGPLFGVAEGMLVAGGIVGGLLRRLVGVLGRVLGGGRQRKGRGAGEDQGR